MAKIQAKKIADALKKAQRVGEVEEAFSLAGCSIVLRSLTNPEYVATTAALEGLEDIEYAVAFRVEHICRSLCEFGGESLREVDFIEVDVENPKTGKVESQLLERHQFVKDYILSSWSREAMDVAMRKFTDVVEKAERAASNGIHFETPEESYEEAYRRLLAEAKEMEGAVPFELATKIRDEFGYVLKQELTAVDDKLTHVQVPDEGPREEELKPAPDVATRALEERKAAFSPEANLRNTDAIMRRGPTAGPSSAPAARQPSKEALEAVVKSVQEERALVVPAIPPMGSPVTVNPALASKQAELAALEGDVSKETVGATPATAYAPTLENRPLRRDPTEAAKILDQPPAGGINPRFKAPPKL